MSLLTKTGQWQIHPAQQGISEVFSPELSLIPTLVPQRPCVPPKSNRVRNMLKTSAFRVQTHFKEGIMERLIAMTSDLSFEDDEITVGEADMFRLKMTQKKDDKGNMLHFWSRQAISKTQDIRAGYIANWRLGWYDFNRDKRGQTKAEAAIHVQGIATKDWASESFVKENK